jgi:hypothetical protein
MNQHFECGRLYEGICFYSLGSSELREKNLILILAQSIDPHTAGCSKVTFLNLTLGKIIFDYLYTDFRNYARLV